VFGIFDLISYSYGPSRRTAKSMRNSSGVHGHILFKEQPIGYESGLEKLFAQTMAIDPQVTDIIHQPMTYKYEVTSIEQELYYTPDYRVIRDLSKPWIWGDSLEIPPCDCLYEVKPIERLHKMKATERGPRASLVCKIQDSKEFGFQFFTNTSMPRHQIENVSRVGSSNADPNGLRLARKWLSEFSIGDQISFVALAERLVTSGYVAMPILLGLMKERVIAGQYSVPNFLETKGFVIGG
jgi:hypothetical protein